MVQLDAIESSCSSYNIIKTRILQSNILTMQNKKFVSKTLRKIKLKFGSLSSSIGNFRVNVHAVGGGEEARVEEATVRGKG